MTPRRLRFALLAAFLASSLAGSGAAVLFEDVRGLVPQATTSGWSGFALPGVVVLRHEDDARDRHVLYAHESVHLGQYRRHGALPTLLGWAFDPDRRLSLEAEAFAMSLCVLQRRLDAKGLAEEKLRYATRLTEPPYASRSAPVDREEALRRIDAHFWHGEGCQDLLKGLAAGPVLVLEIPSPQSGSPPR